MAYNNITYLIGNGFDKSLNLHTGYSDFYKYYLNQSSLNDNIKTLKENISINSDLWSDLEIGLGHYTKYLQSSSDVEDIFFNISDALKEYLIIEEGKFNPNIITNEKPLLHLLDPTESLSEDNAIFCEDCLFDPESTGPSFGSIYSDIFLNVISFNYTNTLEKILNVNNSDRCHINHIHGTLSEDIIIGLDNSKQIDNESLLKDVQTRNIIIKPSYNTALENGRIQDAKNMIDGANVIIINGMSLGETDKMWWEYVGNWLKSDNYRCLIIDWFDPDSIRLREIQKVRIKDTVKDKFLNAVGLNDNNLKRRIFVRLCHSLFTIKDTLS